MPRPGGYLYVRPPAALLALLGGIAIVSCPPRASAECGGSLSTCIDSEALWPTPGTSTLFSVGSPHVIAPRRFAFGLANSFQRNPIVLRTSAQGPSGPLDVPAIGSQITTTFLFSYGVTSRLQADLAAPMTFYQDGTGLSRVVGGTAIDVPTNVMRDIRIGAAYAIIAPSRAGVPSGRPALEGVAISARFDLGVPTGDRDHFAGDRGAVAIPAVLVEERVGHLTLGAQLGARIRRSAALLGRAAGSQAYLAGGGAFAFDSEGRYAISGEVFALPSLVSSGASSYQWLTGFETRSVWGGDLVFHAGVGGALRGGTTAQLSEPAWRFVLDLRFAPLGIDSDGDGIPDRDDKCPNEPEDRDGFEDADGCPDPDNDRDGIPDFRDKCPSVPEDIDGFEDEDGCPEPDRDHDGIKDAVDKCPDVAEDIDGFEDKDGCPEGGAPHIKCADGSFARPGERCDVDRDGIPDEADKCPLVAEDFDGIVDDDGCPEKDADEDGVGDPVDQCPLIPETINGVADDDGCPEPGAHSLVTFAAGVVEVEKPIRLPRGGATVSRAMQSQIAMIAQRVQGLVDRGVERVIVESWGDAPGDTPGNRQLAQRRADAIAAALVAAGVPALLIRATLGDLDDPPPSPRPNYVVSVRTKRKEPLSKLPSNTPAQSMPPTLQPAGGATTKP